MKRPKINEKEAGVGPFKNITTYFLVWPNPIQMNWRPAKHWHIGTKKVSVLWVCFHRHA